MLLNRFEHEVEGERLLDEEDLDALAHIALDQPPSIFD
jgi:hypothetical protein